MIKKIKGFTLVEVIVVVAIIGVLAALLVPNMLGYARNAKAREYNSNARSVLTGAQIAIVELNNAGVDVPPNSIFIGSDDCIAHEVDGSLEIELVDYMGDHFNGNFAFITDTQGYGCKFALWSSADIPMDSIVQMSEREVKDSINSALPIGCHPLRPMDQ